MSSHDRESMQCIRIHRCRLSGRRRSASSGRPVRGRAVLNLPSDVAETLMQAEVLQPAAAFEIEMLVQ